MITGDRSGISEETNEVYRVSGLYHILSISVLHMVIMGGFLFFCSAVLVGIVSGAGTQPSDSEVGAIGAILGAFGYLKISGGSFATLRSFVMIANFFLSNLADQQAIALRNVALAALAILLMFPESVVDPGFQMSFAAVVGQVASYEVLAGRAEPWVQGRPSWHWRIIAFLAAIVGSTLVASATVAPIGIYDFHQVQYLAVLANFLAVPFCNLIVMPAGLATLVLMPFWGGGRSALGHGAGTRDDGNLAKWVAGLQGSQAVSQRFQQWQYR
ncbi:MAG: ComEC/Rec2 family competence protein [Filomicrobium sp.]